MRKVRDRRPKAVCEFAATPAAEMKQALAGALDAYRSRHETELLHRASGTQLKREI
ncbi:hypothetical protein [Rhodococcus sp. YH1]|uniref:hypothetical protein n=1 Tax=Rhodococcus sp. YH1 TaxID=89066 RepID=UPI001386A575|nr:hypothetical protein [Rhodococcus sp. YH1]